MEIRQLIFFKFVSELKSFTKASEKLNVSQPTITIAIKKLEEELGVQLLERNNKRVAVSIAGKVFLRHVDLILNDIENARTEMIDFSNKKEIIRVGITPFIGSQYIPKILTDFKKNHPAVEIILKELRAIEVPELIKKDEIDFGVAVISGKVPLLEYDVIQQKEEIKLVLPQSHPLNQYSKVPIGLLESELIVVMKEGTEARRIFSEACITHGFTPNIAHNSTQLSTILHLVSTNFGIGVLPEVVNTERYNNLNMKSFSEPLFMERSIIRKKGKRLSQTSKKLIDYIKSI